MKKLIMTLFISTVFFSGCAENPLVADSSSTPIKQASTLYDASHHQLAKTPTSGQNIHFVDVSKNVYLGNKIKRIDLRHVVSKKYLRKVTLVTSSDVHLSKIAQIMSNMLGIRVVMSRKFQKRTIGPQDYRGSVSGLMSTLAAFTDASWKYDPGRDRFLIYQYETKTFNLPLFRDITTVDVAINRSGAGGSSSGSSGSSGGRRSKKQEEAKHTMSVIKTLLGKNGKMAFDPVTKTLAITDRPENIDRVSHYIAKVRNRLLTQVLLAVKIYRVRLKNGDRKGFSWNAFFTRLSQYSVNFTRIAPTVGVDLGTPGNVSFTVQKNATGIFRKFGQSNAIFDALAEQGRVSVVTSANVITMSGRLAPIYSMREIGYLKSVTQSIIGGTGSTGTITSQLQPGTIEDGVSVLMLPTVLDGGEILLQIKLSMSNLLDLQSATSGGQTIQTPLLSRFRESPMVKLRSGNSYVISGYRSTNDRNNKSGMFSPSAWFLGGQKENVHKYELTVLVVTPQLIRM